ncbi:MAG: DNA internalization-related competence protein ComEC/Rec2 [Rhodoferax sp.]|nr:DNA internalization-related competence protein ComEC/Rec2 [Rhodoferax sp.]
MKNRHRLLGWPSLLGVLLGVVLQLQQGQLSAASVYVCFVLAGLSLYALTALKSEAISGVVRDLALTLAVGLLAFGVTDWRAGVFAHGALQPALQGRDIAVVGTVASMPQPFEGGLRFRFDLASSTLDGAPVTLPPRVELAWYSGAFGRIPADADDPLAQPQRTPALLQAGQRWQFTVRLKAPHGGVNPYGFDYELWQWEQGVQASGYVRTGGHDPAPLLLGSSWQHPVEAARQQVRQRIFAHLPEPRAAGLLAALVVGDQAAIERADWNVFRATGVAHLMSISGLHITLFAWLAAALIGRLWRCSGWLCLTLPAPTAALLGGVALASAYALFSGWGVPAQRTVLMLSVVSLLRLAGLRWPWPQVWLLACAVAAAVDPWALMQAGFWLSFVAVGVLFASDSAACSASGKGARGRFFSAMREQWVITLALTPLSLLLFGQVSLVGLLANALAIPWVTFVVTPLALLGVFWPPLWNVAAWAVAWLGTVLQWLADWPWAVLWLARAPLWLGLLGVVGGVVLVLRLPPNVRLMGVPLLLPVLLWQPPLPPAGQFELLAADVGQGSAVLVRTAGHALLFDAGPRYSLESDAGERVLVPLLRALGVRLDTLVLSHRDSDHMGGGTSVLAMHPGAQLLTSVDPALVLPPASRLLAAALVDVQPCVAGQRWRWDGVDFELLHPQAADYGVVRQSNAMSCVLRIHSAAQTALLTGDIEQAQEALLMKAGVPLRADLLLAPHHGSKTSSSAAFLDAVQPRIALVQVGYRNRFGHPAGTVMGRYADRAIRVVDTPRCGAITWQSWRADMVQCQRETDRRIWRHQLP